MVCRKRARKWGAFKTASARNGRVGQAWHGKWNERTVDWRKIAGKWRGRAMVCRKCARKWGASKPLRHEGKTATDRGGGGAKPCPPAFVRRPRSAPLHGGRAQCALCIAEALWRSSVAYGAFMPHPEGIFKISICGEKTAQLPIRLQARCFCQFSACMHPKIFPDSNRIRLRRSFQSYVCMFFLSNSRIRASLFTAYCHVFFIACPVLPLFLIIWGFCRALSALGVTANSAVCVVEQSDAACLRQERFEGRVRVRAQKGLARARLFACK